jgi:DNA-directed RNA polymerase specialized sigma24 family protein
MQIDPKDLQFANVVIPAEVKKLFLRGIIRRDEQEDFASELMVRLLAVWETYDPARGPREAFINQVVNTRLVSILRERHSRTRRAKTEPINPRDERLADPTWSGDGWLRQIDLRVDLTVAFGKLNPKQRAICDQLLREALSPAAKEMGVPRSTLRDAVAKIRQIFRDAGLEEYL